MATIQRPRPVAPSETTLGPDAAAPVASGPGLSLAGLVGVVVTLAGFLIGLQRLSDNSFFTHLATGRLILDGGIPTTDPYSFTAAGEPWTVQSWLASVLYALAEDVAGLGGVRIVVALTTALLAYLLWRLTEPAGTVVVRAALLVPVLLMGTEGWAERPMLFGFVGLAALYVLANGAGPAWVAAPMLWIWVNTHGSFPMGFVLLGTLVVGTWLDRRSARRELEVSAWAGLGLLLGAINPIGPKLLVFPIELLGKAETLSFIDEWRPPDYGDLAPKLLVLMAGLSILALLARHRRFRAFLPLLVFTGLALTSARNVAPAGLIVMAAVAPALAGLGSDLGQERRPIFRTAAVVLGALTLVVAVGTLRGPQTDLAFYPTDAVDWMEDHDLVGPDVRVISRDFVGNYLEARYVDMPVFMDDRYDMFPVEVIDDYRTLMTGDEGWEQIAEAWDADAVLWNTDADLAEQLTRSTTWRVAYEDANWVLVVPS